MIITYNKTYRQEAEYDHFIVRGYPHNTTNVFDEYWNLIKEHPNATKEEITKIVKEFKPKSKSNLSIYYTEDRIEFTKPNKVIFPVFFIEFKDISGLDETIVWKDPECNTKESLIIQDEWGQFPPPHWMSGLDKYKEESDSNEATWKINKKLID